MIATTEPVLITLSDVAPTKVRWLWPNRVPLGKLTMFVGDPGIGKSFVALDLAARVSTGSNEVTSCGDVILLSAEDDPADTIRPRLDSVKADTARIHYLKSVRTSDNGTQRERMFRLTQDIAQIAEALNRHPQTKLVIIDPLSAYMGGVDGNKDEDVRSILAPLAELAAKYGVAIVCIKHMNKAEEKSAMYRAGGSIAYIAAVRIAWMFLKDRNNPQRNFMLPLKCNIGPTPDGVAYSIQETDSGPRVVWESQPIKVNLEDALRPAVPNRETKLEKAKKWLSELLADGPLSSNDVDEAATKAGFSLATLRRASEEINVARTRAGFGQNGQWQCSLPSIDAQLPL
ncbi:MAG: hypothetical protein DMG65_06535 [Candidatus Angelobacter sp. Gp1-AA117]|nr:MAG: hypothetical protein DMG65_06535 [Candidatus Angelobacter sp. Gp1-AA117]